MLLEGTLLEGGTRFWRGHLLLDGTRAFFDRTLAFGGGHSLSEGTLAFGGDARITQTPNNALFLVERKSRSRHTTINTLA